MRGDKAGPGGRYERAGAAAMLGALAGAWLRGKYDALRQGRSGGGSTVLRR